MSSRSASPAADLKSMHSHQQSRSDREAVESLEALWNPSSSDDGRATLEQLQSAVASQGTSRGLNGMPLPLCTLLDMEDTVCCQHSSSGVMN